MEQMGSVMTDKINIRIDELDVVVPVYVIVIPEDDNKMEFSFDYNDAQLSELGLTRDELGEKVGQTLIEMLEEWMERQRE